MMKNLTLIIIAIVLPCIVSAQAPKYLVNYGNEMQKDIVKMDLSYNRISTIYNVVGNSYIDDIQVTVDESYVSFIEVTDKSKNEIQLKIIDPKGNLIATIDDNVQRYVWSPNGKHIAYVSGDYYEGGIGFTPKNVVIFEISSKEANIINTDKYIPYKLHWTLNNVTNLLYMKVTSPDSDETVIKYDFEKKRVEVTPYYSIHFSPDGLYYYISEGEAAMQNKCIESNMKKRKCFQIFDAKTNTLVQEINEISNFQPISWVYNEGHLLLFNKQSFLKREKTIKRGDRTITIPKIVGIEKSVNYVYDVKNNKYVETFDGVLKKGTSNPRPWKSSTKFIVATQVGLHQKKSRSANDIIIKAIPKEY